MIVIVDDHPDICRGIELTLRLSGLPARCFCDPFKALVFVRKERPTLLLLDMMMPGMSGIELLTAVRAEPNLQGLPVVMMSACPTERAVADAARLGVGLVLSKCNFEWSQLPKLISRSV
ncbi:MAG TPA: response regulator [Tepidisphaeraceae bacterium]|jgi:DNA-binding response OmpR family regulator|nr:response regulator [Tepidisphaeraceae bacterium]